jgi:hypothetical protein
MTPVLDKFEEEEDGRALKAQTPPRVRDVPNRVEFPNPIVPETARVGTEDQHVSRIPAIYDPSPIARRLAETASPAHLSCTTGPHGLRSDRAKVM